jgi:Yip1 domain
MLDRIMGVLTLKSLVYRQIADDTTATGQAATIVVVVAIIQGLVTGLIQLNPDGTYTTSLIGALIGAIVTVVLALAAWGLSSWVLSAVAGALGGKTNTSEMLRVTGYVRIFNLVSILNILVLVSTALGCITGLMNLVIAVLALIGYVIGVREAAEFSTGRAIGAALLAALVNFVILAIGTAIVAGILLAMGAVR